MALTMAPGGGWTASIGDELESWLIARLPRDDGLDRLEDDDEIQRDRQILDVYRSCSFSTASSTLAPYVTDLRPTGESRFHHMPLAV